MNDNRCQSKSMRPKTGRFTSPSNNSRLSGRLEQSLEIEESYERLIDGLLGRLMAANDVQLRHRLGQAVQMVQGWLEAERRHRQWLESQIPRQACCPEEAA